MFKSGLVRIHSVELLGVRTDGTHQVRVSFTNGDSVQRAYARGKNYGDALINAIDAGRSEGLSRYGDLAAIEKALDELPSARGIQRLRNVETHAMKGGRRVRVLTR